MRWTSSKREVVGCIALAAMIGVVVSGCDPIDEDEMRDAPGDPFEVIFDAEEAIIPLPSTLALDEDGTFPEAGTCEAGENTAQGYFDDYLAQLSGWPDATPITVHLSSTPDMDTIGDDDVQLWRSAAGGDWERVENLDVDYHDENVDPCTGESTPAHILEIVPAEGEVSVHGEYFAFVSGNIESEAGSRLLASEPMYLALQPIELVDEDGNSVIDMLSDEDAQALQAVRNTIAPALEVIEDETDFAPQELAGVWQWHTWNDTFVVFDPALPEVPFPHSAMMGDDGTVDLPLPEEGDPTRGIVEAINQRPGFSTNAPGWVTLWGGIDESTLTHDSVVKGPQEGVDTELMGEEDYELHYHEEWDRIVIEPMEPLMFGQNYVVAVTNDIVGANGRPVQPTPAFVFLRSPYPLVDGEGASAVDALDDASAQGLEAGRQDFELLCTVAPMLLGKDCEDIATAWVYDTEDPTEPMDAYRDLVLDEIGDVEELQALRACEVEGTDCEDDPHLVEVGDTIEDPNDGGVDVAMENVSHVYTGGEFASVPVDILQGVVGDGEERVGISVYLPQEEQADGTCEAPFDVVIAQHGLGQDRHHSGVAMANDLAAYPGCLATVAMDLPLHGGRVIPDEGVPDPHPESTPASSGEGFFTADLLTTKSNFVQGVMDLTVLAQIIQEEMEVEIEDDNGNDDNGNDDNGNDDNGNDDNGNDDNGNDDNGNDDNGNDEESTIIVGGLDGLFADLEGVDGPLFTDRVGYVGFSAGGILGVTFAAVESAVESVVLNGTGGRIAWLLEGDEDGPSEFGAPILEMLADDTDGPGLEPGDQGFFEAMLFIQWLADRVDPVNFASTVGEETEVLLQMIDGDRVIVNRGTEILAREMDVELEETTFEDVGHGFIFAVDENDDDFEAGECARLQAAAWLDSGLGGEGEIPAGLTATECLE